MFEEMSHFVGILGGLFRKVAVGVDVHEDRSLGSPLDPYWSVPVRPIAISILAGGLAAVTALSAPPSQSVPGHFVLTSPDAVPARPFLPISVGNGYGCTGGNKSPALEWDGVPAGTKSFAITMFDSDEHGSPSGWWHWVVYDIPGSVNHLPQGAGAETSRMLPTGARQGRNDEGKLAYSGPCPDKGQPPHHYVITIYALSVATLPLPHGASGANLTYTARDYVLGSAIIVAAHARE
jgi:Raf kinase inhibitor-like YbhB/YbcL family protein